MDFCVAFFDFLCLEDLGAPFLGGGGGFGFSLPGADAIPYLHHLSAQSGVRDMLLRRAHLFGRGEGRGMYG